eukprot:scaffold37213_cov43-Cyclotella_meneghiniana.AAC.1
MFNSIMSNNMVPREEEYDDDSSFVTAADDFDVDMDEDFSIQGDVQFDLQALQDDVIVNEPAINNDQDDSSGSVLSVYQMEMPHADDQPEPPNPIQQALNEFLLSHPLCVPITVAILSYFQNIRDVPRDGHAFNGNVTQFRQDVYRHLSRVLATNANERPFRDAVGHLLADFRGPRRTVMANVGSGIWERGQDFSRPVGVQHYCDVFRHIPAMSHYLANDIIVYNTADETTTIFVYNDVLSNVTTFLYNDGAKAFIHYRYQISLSKKKEIRANDHVSG